MSSQVSTGKGILGEHSEIAKILVVDDEQMIRFAFEQFLKDEEYQPLLAQDAESAIEQVRNHQPQIVFLDYRLSGENGLDILKEIREINQKTAVVFMTAFGAMDVAIKAMQLGAYEYLTKPLDLDKIRILIGRILEGKKSLEALGPDGDEDTSGASMDKIVGKSPAMQDVFKMIGLLTTQDVTVLITGESGVGKELVARAIHENSPRKDNAFVAINCGALPENLLEAEMFGYEKGAFTGADAQKLGKFEVADGGTIFLDEIGELQPLLQVKLLRVLQEKAFERVGGNVSIQTDARILAATNKDLQDEVDMGRFRTDLFYRLHLIQVQLPPLRERREDIPPLIEHIIRRANSAMGRRVRGVTSEAQERLEAYFWPGNVRELENQIKRAMVLSREDILPEHLFEMDTERIEPTSRKSERQLSDAAVRYMTEASNNSESSQDVFGHVVGTVEEALIREALEKTGGNQLQAAQMLGLHRSTLRKKMKDHKITA